MVDKMWDELLSEDPAKSPVTEHVSYNAEDEDAKNYGMSAYWQLEMVKEAVYQHNIHRHGIGGDLSFIDLRGRSFFVTVADDGLSVKVVEE